MEYYSALKRNELSSNEKEQTQKDYIFHLYEISRIGKSTETEKGLVVARGWEVTAY